jgi:hypothetical protein
MPLQHTLRPLDQNLSIRILYTTANRFFQSKQVSGVKHGFPSMHEQLRAHMQSASPSRISFLIHSQSLCLSL